MIMIVIMMSLIINYQARALRALGLLPTPIKIRIFGPKTAKFGPKSAFLVILGQILPFFAHFVQCPTKNQCELGA